VVLVPTHRVALPRALPQFVEPQFVEHCQVLIGVVVAGIVLELIDLAHVARGGREITGTQHVGDEETVETAGFQRFGQVDPVIEGVVIPRSVLGVPPQTG
jgi:hypothetical protein